MFTLLVSLAAPLQGSPRPVSVPPAAARGLPPVALWLSDTSLDPGARGRAFVRLREPGYLVVVRADGDGRISIVFPGSPVEEPRVPGGATYEIPGPDGRASFAVTEPAGTGTVLAARRAAPFRFAALAAGDAWDSSALLLQPTAGDPRAALLDVVDRLADGRPFEYDVATYTVTPAVIAAAPPDVYAPIVSPIYGSNGSASPSPPAYVMPAAPAPAGPAATVNADCSSAYITNGSACASIVYNAAPEQAPSVSAGQQYSPYYNPYLYYPPWYFSHPRVARDTVKPPPDQAMALQLRPRAVSVPQRVGGRVVTLSMPRVLRSQSASVAAPATVPRAAAPALRFFRGAEPAAPPAPTQAVTHRILAPVFAASSRAAPVTALPPAETSAGAAIALPRVWLRRARP